MGTRRPPRLSAGVVVVRRDGDGWLYLLLRAFRSWDFPKGMVEPGEEPFAAARREVREESSIEDLVFTWGDVCHDTGPYTRNKIARYYVAQTRTERVTLPVNAELGVPEHHEWRWVDFDDALSLVSPRVAPVVEWARGVLLGTAPQA
ncbi:MAG: RNA pyrophosphohydrolase [Steroidobacteraceae bacterium]|nr:RNA pyrophosphohydrolase [Steroidobacteraceae bacterium]